MRVSFQCLTWPYYLQPKPAPSAAAPSQAPSTPSRAAPTTPAAPQAPAPSTTTAPSAAPATPSPATQAPSDAPAFNDPSALLAGTQSEPVIAHIESMGFERPAIHRAMRAAFFNPDRAIEYLVNVSIRDYSYPRQRGSLSNRQ